MSTKVLVTGSNGQLGKTIEELYMNNKEVDFVFVSKQELDITNKKSIKEVFAKDSFNYCINCAAYTNVEQAEKTPDIAFKVNADGVKYLAEICKEADTILMHISTDYVFDGKKGEPYRIDDKPNPINEYGKSKLLGEQYIQRVLSKYFIIRTSWLYSKIYGKNFYRSIVEKAKKERNLFVTSEQTGCPTDTVNLAQYILDIIAQNKRSFGVHHFCDGKTMSWFDFAKQILIENNLINETKLVRVNNYVTFAKRPINSVLINN